MFNRTNAFLLIALSAIATAGFSQVPDPGEPIRIDTRLVSVPVIVADRNARYVPDLTSADFTIFQDGHQQSIEFFAPEVAADSDNGDADRLLGTLDGLRELDAETPVLGALALLIILQADEVALASQQAPVVHRDVRGVDVAPRDRHRVARRLQPPQPAIRLLPSSHLQDDEWEPRGPPSSVSPRVRRARRSAGSATCPGSTGSAGWEAPPERPEDLADLRLSRSWSDRVPVDAEDTAFDVGRLDGELGPLEVLGPDRPARGMENQVDEGVAVVGLQEPALGRPLRRQLEREASRRDLRRAMNAQRFREDLDFRIAQTRVEPQENKMRIEEAFRRFAEAKAGKLALPKGPAALYQLFGAPGAYDAATNTDLAYNWGVFDFDAADFLPRFLKGSMRYWLAVYPTAWPWP